MKPPLQVWIEANHEIVRALMRAAERQHSAIFHNLSSKVARGIATLKGIPETTEILPDQTLQLTRWAVHAVRLMDGTAEPFTMEKDETSD